METGAAKGQKLLHCKSHKVSAGDEEDRISNLPDRIIHRIFDFLPIDKVAETCVLSKRWKQLWYSYPCLDFISVFDDRTQQPDCIDHIVRLLEKHSDVKMLRFDGPVGFPSAVNRLMKKAVRHNVQILDIEFKTQKPFTLARCVIRSLSLRDLRLKSRFNDPHISLPPLKVMENGFKSLQSLSLLGVNLRHEPSLLNLFTDSSFPSLTNLCLESCLGLKFLRIQMTGLREFALNCCRELRELHLSAEKLEKLSVVSCFTHYASTRVKIDAPLLERIVWSRNAIVEECDIGMFDSLGQAVVGLSLNHREDKRSDRKMRSLSNFLTGISQCQSLTAERELIEILSRIKLCVFERLRCLTVHTCCSSKGDARGLASLFRSSPFVDTITISIEKDAFGYHEGKKIDFWESQAQSLDPFLGCLRFAKVFGFGHNTNDGGLVKFLLKHVKDLQRLSVSKVGYSIMEDIVESHLIFE